MSKIISDEDFAKYTRLLSAKPVLLGVDQLSIVTNSAAASRRKW